jgi:hypothetical protein
MKTREFLEHIPELLRSQLPPELRDFRVLGPMANLTKFHYGDPRIHYEVWIQRRIGMVEIGLHFEGDAAANRKHLEEVCQRIDLRAAVGPEVEAEQWTESWTRIHESLPLEPLEEDYIFEVAWRTARLMKALEPIVRAQSVA